VQKHQGQAANYAVHREYIKKKLIRIPGNPGGSSVHHQEIQFMKCPYCEKEIGGVTCPHCSRENPEEARYCMYCGSVLGLEEAPEEEPAVVQSDDHDDLDLDNRILCPDGSCTGIIVNGRCTECGRRYPDDGETGEGGGNDV
jgi:hypothetical protein